MNNIRYAKNTAGRLNAGTLVLLGLLIMALALLPALPIQAADWYSTSWNYRRAVTLSSATSQANYQVLVALTTATMGTPYANVKSDGSDIRFTGSDGTTLQDYWIESWDNSGDSKIWVEVKLSGTSEIYMYYGNASASAASDGDATFLFFDDFDRADSPDLNLNLASDKWDEYTTGSANAEIKSNALRFTPWDGVKDIIVVSKSFTTLSGKFRWKFNIDWHRNTAGPYENEKNYWLYMQLGDLSALDNGQQKPLEDRIEDSASAHTGTGVDLLWYKGKLNPDPPHEIVSYYDNDAIHEDVAQVSGSHSVEVVGDTSTGTYSINVDGGDLEKTGAGMNATTTLNAMRFLAHGINSKFIPTPRDFAYTFITGYTDPDVTTSVGGQESGGGGGLYVELECFTATGSNGQVMLSWSTASEIGAAGFNILRSDFLDGEFVRVNYALVPSRGNPFTGADYTYTDYAVANGNAYYYMLEEIETDGDASLHGPVIAAPGIISLLSPMDGGSVSLSDPGLEIAAPPDVKRAVLYISSSPTLKRGKGTIRLKVRGKSGVRLGKRARKRLAKLARENAWELYCGVYGLVKGERGLKLLSNVNKFTVSRNGRVK